MISERRGRSVRLFYENGDREGVTVASITNWSGLVLQGRGKYGRELLARQEAERAGCYILQGEDPDHPMGKRAYIGYAGVLRDRVKQHLKGEWWDEVVLISTMDAYFSTGHYQTLESRMIRIARENKRAAVDNRNQPHMNAGRLGEADQADITAFVEHLQLVLPPIGVNLLAESLARRPKEELVTFDPTDVFEIKRPSGADARALETGSEFIVLEGSLAATKSHAHNGSAKLRKALIDDGTLVLEPDGRTLRFTRNQAFSSSSTAANVVLNRQSSGYREWLHLREQLNYGQWKEQQQASYKAPFSSEDEE